MMDTTSLKRRIAGYVQTVVTERMDGTLVAGEKVTVTRATDLELIIKTAPRQGGPRFFKVKVSEVT